MVEVSAISVHPCGRNDASTEICSISAIHDRTRLYFDFCDSCLQLPIAPLAYPTRVLSSSTMTDDQMDVDEPFVPAASTSTGTEKPANAMAALMAGAKAKGKERATGDGSEAFGMSEAELKALNEREGMPWYVVQLCLGHVQGQTADVIGWKSIGLPRWTRWSHIKTSQLLVS